jgi:hypothetical protein
MRIETYSDHVALLRALGTLRQQAGLTPRGILFLALSSQGRIYLGVPDEPAQIEQSGLRVGEKLTLRWPDGPEVPQRLYHFDSIHALRDDFCVYNGDRRLKDPGNAIDVGGVVARFIRSAGTTSVFFGCTPHQPGSWLQGGQQVVSLHDYGIVEVVPVPIGLLARRLHDHRLYLLTFADIARTGHLEGWLPVYTSPLGNILLVERRVVKNRLVLSCERGLVEIDLTDLPHVHQRATLPLAPPRADYDDEDDEEDYTDVNMTCPAVLGRLDREAFVLTSGTPQPWGLKDLAPAELWAAPTGEIGEIRRWVQQIGTTEAHAL